MLQSELRDGVALVSMDDGKANAVSESFSAALEAGLGFALANANAVIVSERPGRFSAGYDLNVIRQRPEVRARMREAGARNAGTRAIDVARLPAMNTANYGFRTGTPARP